MIIEKKTKDTTETVFHATHVDDQAMIDAYEIIKAFNTIELISGCYDGVEFHLEIDAIDIDYKQFTSLEEFKTWYAVKNYNIALEAEIV